MGLGCDEAAICAGDFVSRRPLLFLDVDGPRNPNATPSGRCPEDYVIVHVPTEAHPSGAVGVPRFSVRPEVVWLNPAHGRALPALGFEPCWAGAWMSDANRWIGPPVDRPGPRPSALAVSSASATP